VSDRILLEGMVFQGTHGVHPEEQVTPQPFEVDVELALDLQPAGLNDDLERTIDYSKVFATTGRVVESTRFLLIEALGEAIAEELLATYPADEVVIRIRKPAVDLGGRFRAVGIEIRRASARVRE
jgi:7,8-dihydroneopterin aldolase/epimerase/oxygenase